MARTINDLKETAKREAQSEAERLAGEARSLARRLEEVAAKAEEAAARIPEHEGRFYTPANPLGECQGMAHDVDLACARLDEKIRQMNYLLAIES